MADVQATTKSVRVRGRDYTISLMLTTDAIVAYLRLVQLGAGNFAALVGKGATEGVEVGVLMAQAFAHGFKIADLQPGGDLYPLLACVRLEGQTQSIAGSFDTAFAGRLSELLAVLKEAAAFNFEGFTGDFTNEIAALFVGVQKSEASK
jgi:hypothetical protein